MRVTFGGGAPVRAGGLVATVGSGVAGRFVAGSRVAGSGVAGRFVAGSCVIGLFMAGLLVAACGPPPAAPPPPRDLDAEARGAATTFVHCYERDGAECRHVAAPYRAWHALRTLVAVRDHSPLTLAEDLPGDLHALRDDAVARRLFIAQLAGREPVARTGQCGVVSLRRLGDAIAAVVTAARARLETLGLGDTGTAGSLAELGDAAASLREAREVRLTCAGGRELHLVVAPTPDGGWHPVHLGDAPVAVGAAAAAVTPVTITISGSDAVDPWLPFGEDEL